MAGPPPDPAPGDGRAPVESALPSPAARLLAFGAILIAGICGGLIGWKVTELQVDDGSMLPGMVGLIGAAAAAGGVAVLSVLVLRAMGEWSTIVATGDPAAPRKRPS